MKKPAKIQGTDYRVISIYNGANESYTVNFQYDSGDSVLDVNKTSFHDHTSNTNVSGMPWDSESEYLNNVFLRAVDNVRNELGKKDYKYNEEVSKIISEKMAIIIREDKNRGTYGGR